MNATGDNPTGDRLSRWTPAMFACALVNLGLGLALAVLGLAWPAAPAAAPASLAMVHLLTIGWLTLLMFAALFQFVPVITSRALPSQTPPLVALIGIEAGLALMVAGFLSLGDGTALLLPAGGALVIAALALGAGTLLVPLLAKRPMPLSARFVVAGLGFLLLTVLLGLCFALALAVPAPGPALAPLLAGGLAAHALAGIGGWFTLTAIGVSYELLPMFMLAPHDRGVLGATVLWTGTAGFLAAVFAGLAGAFWPAVMLAALATAGRLAICVALALYLFDVARLYRSRMRRRIELHNRAAIGAFVSLGLAVLLGLGAILAQRLEALAPSLVLLLLLGWLSGLGLTQLYKIVAFLSWLSRYGTRLGRGAVPRVQDLVHEPAATWLFALYFGAVGLAALAAALTGAPGRAEAIRGALAVALVAVLLLGREYLRAWRASYVRPPNVGPAATPAAPLIPAGKDGTR